MKYIAADCGNNGWDVSRDGLLWSVQGPFVRELVSDEKVSLLGAWEQFALLLARDFCHETAIKVPQDASIEYHNHETERKWEMCFGQDSLRKILPKQR